MENRSVRRRDGQSVTIAMALGAVIVPGALIFIGLVLAVTTIPKLAKLAHRLCRWLAPNPEKFEIKKES